MQAEQHFACINNMDIQEKHVNHICILNFFGIRTDPQAIIEQEVVLFFMCLCNFLLQILLWLVVRVIMFMFS